MGSLPPNLTHLELGISFRHHLNMLPPSLCHLSFSFADRCLVNWKLTSLPNLTHLSIGGNFRQNILLPPSLNSLVLEATALYHEWKIAPTSLSHFNDELQKSSISKLTLGSSFNLPVSCLMSFSAHLIPPLSITWLCFGDHFDQPVESLVGSLLHLEFGNLFNQRVDSLPQSLQYLKVAFHFNQLVNSLPPCLISLHFGESFNQKINNLPSSITHLWLGFGFKQELVLPCQIRFLSVHREPVIRTHHLPQKVVIQYHMEYKQEKKWIGLYKE